MSFLHRLLARPLARQCFTAFMIGMVPGLAACTSNKGGYTAPPEIERRGSH